MSRIGLPLPSQSLMALALGVLLVCRRSLAALPLPAAGTGGSNIDAAAAREPQPPVWPEVYTLEYQFSMPHLYLTQPKGLSYNVVTYYDGINGLRRMEVYDGTDISLRVQDWEYTVYPRINQLDCDAWQHGSTAPPAPPLPRLAAWEYGGTTTLDGRAASIWQLQEKNWDKVNQYIFYATPDGVPLRFHMMGVNYITDSHPDEYIYDFTRFTLGLPLPSNGSATSSAFDVPALCKDAVLRQQQQQQQEGQGQGAEGQRGRHPAAEQQDTLLPLVHTLDHRFTYHVWARAHGRVHERHEFDARLERFARVSQLVQERNADPASSYRLRVNAWADLTEEEFREAKMPNRVHGNKQKEVHQMKKQQQQAQQRPRAGEEAGEGEGALLSQLGGAYAPVRRFVTKKTRADLPVSVDWRGTGADPGVKDQGMCGSCYAFAAVGAMEGAWYVSTGHRRSFSEQQVIDCAWDYGVNGCGGGDYQPVFRYITDQGGIAMEQDYPYMGEQGWCRAGNTSMAGHFEGYMAVASRDDAALMEAVWTYGPIAIAVDPDDEGFRYYSEGVYDYPLCRTRAKDLGHAVILFGYGTEGGKDFWLVRNVWSKYFGDDGYIKIARGKHDCGVSTDPAVALVPEKLQVAGAREAAMRIAAKWAPHK